MSIRYDQEEAEEILRTHEVIGGATRLNLSPINAGRPPVARQTGADTIDLNKEFNHVDKVLEKDFQRDVIKELQDAGYLVCEFRKARIKKDGKDVYRTPFGADGVGFYDIVAIKPPVVLFLENKTDTGKASPEQMRWLMAGGQCSEVKTFVATPSGWPAIKKQLEV
jgi:hypothetical protein